MSGERGHDDFGQPVVAISGAWAVRPVRNRVHAELNRRDHRITRCTMHRLMRTDGLRGISRAKGSAHRPPAGRGPDTRPDLLNRDFKAQHRTG